MYAIQFWYGKWRRKAKITFSWISIQFLIDAKGEIWLGFSRGIVHDLIWLKSSSPGIDFRGRTLSTITGVWSLHLSLDSNIRLWKIISGFSIEKSDEPWVVDVKKTSFYSRWTDLSNEGHKFSIDVFVRNYRISSSRDNQIFPIRILTSNKNSAWSCPQFLCLRKSYSS